MLIGNRLHQIHMIAMPRLFPDTGKNGMSAKPLHQIQPIAYRIRKMFREMPVQDADSQTQPLNFSRIMPT